MAKYLQGLYIDGPEPSFDSSKAEAEKFYAENKYLWSSVRLIQDFTPANDNIEYSVNLRNLAILPPEIGQLQGLTNLELNRNKLTGSQITFFH